MSYVVPGGNAKVPSLSPPVGKEWVPIAIHRCCWNSTENPSILNTFFTFTTCFSVKIVKNRELLGTKKKEGASVFGCEWGQRQGHSIADTKEDSHCAVN